MNHRPPEAERDDVVSCHRENIHRLSHMSATRFYIHTEHASEHASEMKGRDTLEERHAGAGMWRGHRSAKEVRYGT